MSEQHGFLTTDLFDQKTSVANSVKAPLRLHSHFASAMEDMSLLKAIEPGADIVDVNGVLRKIPGVMPSNSVNPLRGKKALDKIEQPFRQLPIVCKELGQPAPAPP